MTEYEINGKEYDVDYDLDNRIIKVDVDNDDVEYRYDALGRRVIRQEGTTKTALIWWGNSENAEHKHQAGQTVIQNDIMAHPSRLNSVIARAVDGSKFKLEWYHKNYLDHVYAVSDDSGDILEHYRYTAFGEVTIYNASGNQVTTTQIDNHILWNTRRRDELTGFYMYKFRHYSAELGRWLSRDPIEENGGVNLYAFCLNRPIVGFDYLGNGFIDWISGKEGWIPGMDTEKDLNDTINEVVTQLEAGTKAACTILNKFLADPVVSCSCTILGVLDVAGNAVTNPVAEVGDCVCNILQTLVNACNHGGLSHQALIQGMLTMADCTSTSISGGIGAIVSGGNPFGAAAGALILDPIIDAGVYAAQNYINTGNPMPMQGICDCIEVIQNIPIP